ncbi:retrovirus-related Pol polyprotein from transposon 412 [Trichonephila clavipes]|nr:retrovirus-related Pol polyprotein from transposon 412 [Trichonephila clavipes]
MTFPVIRKYLDCPGLETSATPATFPVIRKNLDYPGLETSATPPTTCHPGQRDNSCHKKEYLDHPGLKINTVSSTKNSLKIGKKKEIRSTRGLGSAVVRSADQRKYISLSLFLSVDHPTTPTGNKYLLTVMCMSSKYPDAVPVPDIASTTVVEALFQIFSRMGFPKEIQTDQGTSFTSILTSVFFENFGINVVRSSVYHPQKLDGDYRRGDPVVEYVFQLINRLKSCQELAIEKMEETKIKRKAWYDKNAIKREFSEGDLVLVLKMNRPNKLSVQWKGPGKIEKKNFRD